MSVLLQIDGVILKVFFQYSINLVASCTLFLSFLQIDGVILHVFFQYSINLVASCTFIFIIFNQRVS